MDASAFKQHTVSRGLTYNFYYSPAQPSKHTLVFLHGFPSSSYDWRHQVAFFQPQGFGIVVPDMLGYAGTDKPTGPKAYVGSAVARDIVDILDAVDVQKTIVVSHDWGSLIASRIANLHPDRVVAFAFFAFGYVPPRPNFDLVRTTQVLKQIHGREIFGYWGYYSEDDTDKTIEKNFDSFFSLFFPNDPSLWAAHLGPSGATKVWIEGNRTTALPAHISEEVKQHYKDTLLKGGFAAPLCWYKVQTSGLSAADAKSIPADAYFFSQPAFYGACKNDQVCLPAAGISELKQYARGSVTIHEFDADHWVLISHTEEVNDALSLWIEGLNL